MSEALFLPSKMSTYWLPAVPLDHVPPQPCMQGASGAGETTAAPMRRKSGAQERARDGRRAAEHERRNERLKTLTWETLLSEQLFSRWNEHPPFPPTAFVAAARERVLSAIRELRALGQRPKKGQVRAALKALVEWFNEKDAEFGEVIETEEREDIYRVLEELATVAG